MNTRDAVKKMLNESGRTQVEMARDLGYKSQGTISSALLSKGTRVDTLAKYADYCGYYVGFIKKDLQGIVIIDEL